MWAPRMSLAILIISSNRAWYDETWLCTSIYIVFTSELDRLQTVEIQLCPQPWKTPKTSILLPSYIIYIIKYTSDNPSWKIRVETRESEDKINIWYWLLINKRQTLFRAKYFTISLSQWPDANVIKSHAGAIGYCDVKIACSRLMYLWRHNGLIAYIFKSMRWRNEMWIYLS